MHVFSKVRLLAPTRRLSTVAASHGRRLASPSIRAPSSATPPHSHIPISASSFHTADSYSKDDVDSSPPSSSKTYEVDSDGSASRPNERLPDTSSEPDTTPKGKPMTSSASGSGSDAETHTADSYFKDVDSSPPSSSSTHAVDGSSRTSHRPNDEEFADPEKEYATVSTEHPYEPPVEREDGEKGEQKEQRLRYGGTGKDAERDAPKRGEGPDAGDAGGRKP